MTKRRSYGRAGTLKAEDWVEAARAAIAEIVVFAGPTDVCRPTVASTIRCLVSAWRRARSFSWYFLFITHECTANLDIRESLR